MHCSLLKRYRQSSLQINNNNKPTQTQTNDMAKKQL